MLTRNQPESSRGMLALYQELFLYIPDTNIVYKAWATTLFHFILTQLMSPS
jgi:hypothetical protein